MLRAYVSPTKLETFRQYLAGTYAWATVETVLDSIKGVKVYKQAFDLGTAFHTTLERGPEQYFVPERGQYVVPVYDGKPGEEVLRTTVAFSPRQMNFPQRLRRAYPHMAHECEMQWQADALGCGPVTVRLRLDGANGLEVHEHKTTSHAYSFENYADSAQWRLYLLATGAAVVQYNVFCLLRPEDGGSEAEIEAHVARFYPYPALAEEMADLLRAYLDFVAHYNLQSYVYR